MSYQSFKNSSPGLFNFLKRGFKNFTRKRRDNRYQKKLLSVQQKMKHTKKLLNHLQDQEKNILSEWKHKNNQDSRYNHSFRNNHYHIPDHYRRNHLLRNTRSHIPYHYRNNPSFRNTRSHRADRYFRHNRSHRAYR